MSSVMRWCRRGYHFKPEDDFYEYLSSECKSCFRERIRLSKRPLKTPPGSGQRIHGLRRRLDSITGHELTELVTFTFSEIEATLDARASLKLK